MNVCVKLLVRAKSDSTCDIACDIACIIACDIACDTTADDAVVCAHQLMCPC